jgi:hypothetical protein
MDPTFEVFPGVDNQFYWHLRAGNGQRGPLPDAAARHLTPREG